MKYAYWVRPSPSPALLYNKEDIYMSIEVSYDNCREPLKIREYKEKP